MTIAHTVAGAAAAVSVSQDTIREAINKRQLPAKKTGKRILIKVTDLEKWLDSLEDAAS